jgi:hypothetical protein
MVVRPDRHRWGATGFDRDSGLWHRRHSRLVKLWEGRRRPEILASTGAVMFRSVGVIAAVATVAAAR